MIPTNGENLPIKLYKLKENSPYEYEKEPSTVFYGRPANAIEKNTYRIQKGVNSSSDGILVFCTNCPYDKIKDGDKVEFMGKVWTIASVGYYVQDTRLINSRHMNNEYILKRSPKGIRLQ